MTTVTQPSARRTDYCGLISAKHLDQTVTLFGWVNTRRDHGGVIFIDLRDREGVVQVVCNPGRAEMFANAEKIRGEYVIKVVGKVVRREPNLVNPKIRSGEIEVVCHELEVLNAAVTPPFQIDDENINENVRLEHRVVDLRRPYMQRNMMLRYKVALAVRNHLDQQGFVDIETPMLTKSTPEGARDYLVPSRVHDGMFFALPQSPQLFKQMLMVAGFDRYYQITKCFRDEDLRADRQPEFTQIDCETSFLTEGEIRDIFEGLIRSVFKSAIDAELPAEFPVMAFSEAMALYGSDKPDMRVTLKFTELTDVMKDVAFKVFSGPANSPTGRVAGLLIPGGASISRGEIDGYTEFVKIYGAKGLAYIKVNDVTQLNETGLQSPIVKNLSPESLKAIIERTGAANGDLIFFGADKAKVVNDGLGALRVKIGHEKGHVTGDKWRPLWVVDFPMFEYDDEAKRWNAMHHPFTSPKDGHEDYLDSDPRQGDCQGLRLGSERLGNGWRFGADPQGSRPEQGVPRAQYRCRGSQDQVWLPARRPAVRRAAAWRHRLRPGSHRHHDDRR